MPHERAALLHPKLPLQTRQVPRPAHVLAVEGVPVVLGQRRPQLQPQGQVGVGEEPARVVRGAGVGKGALQLGFVLKARTGRRWTQGKAVRLTPFRFRRRAPLSARNRQPMGGRGRRGKGRRKGKRDGERKRPKAHQRPKAVRSASLLVTVSMAVSRVWPPAEIKGPSKACRGGPLGRDSERGRPTCARRVSCTCGGPAAALVAG